MTRVLIILAAAVAVATSAQPAFASSVSGITIVKPMDSASSATFSSEPPARLKYEGSPHY
jgi:hypothetical protein